MWIKALSGVFRWYFWTCSLLVCVSSTPWTVHSREVNRKAGNSGGEETATLLPNYFRPKFSRYTPYMTEDTLPVPVFGRPLRRYRGSRPSGPPAESSRSRSGETISNESAGAGSRKKRPNKSAETSSGPRRPFLTKSPPNSHESEPLPRRPPPPSRRRGPASRGSRETGRSTERYGKFRHNRHSSEARSRETSDRNQPGNGRTDRSRESPAPKPYTNSIRPERGKPSRRINPAKSLEEPQKAHFRNSAEGKRNSAEDRALKHDKQASNEPHQEQEQDHRGDRAKSRTLLFSGQKPAANFSSAEGNRGTKNNEDGPSTVKTSEEPLAGPIVGRSEKPEDKIEERAHNKFDQSGERERKSSKDSQKDGKFGSSEEDTRNTVTATTTVSTTRSMGFNGSKSLPEDSETTVVPKTAPSKSENSTAPLVDREKFRPGRLFHLRTGPSANDTDIGGYDIPPITSTHTSTVSDSSTNSKNSTSYSNNSDGASYAEPKASAENHRPENWPKTSSAMYSGRESQPNRPTVNGRRENLSSDKSLEKSAESRRDSDPDLKDSSKWKDRDQLSSARPAKPVDSWETEGSRSLTSSRRHSVDSRRSSESAERQPRPKSDSLPPPPPKRRQMPPKIDQTSSRDSSEGSPEEMRRRQAHRRPPAFGQPAPPPQPPRLPPLPPPAAPNFFGAGQMFPIQFGGGGGGFPATFPFPNFGNGPSIASNGPPRTLI